MLDLGNDFRNGERFALDLIQSDHILEIPVADQRPQLAHVQLGNQDLFAAASQNKAEAAGWKRSVDAFSGEGDQFARYVLLQKLSHLEILEELYYKEVYLRVFQVLLRELYNILHLVGN